MQPAEHIDLVNHQQALASLRNSLQQCMHTRMEMLLLHTTEQMGQLSQALLGHPHGDLQQLLNKAEQLKQLEAAINHQSHPEAE